MHRHTFTAALAAVLWIAAVCQGQEPDEKTRVLLVTGANNHDWEWTHRSLARMLEDSGKFHVDITKSPEQALADSDFLNKYQAFVLDYNGPRWGPQAEQNFLSAVRSGTGVVVVHAANNAFPGWLEYEKLVGLCWRSGTGHGRFHPFDVQMIDRSHPITRNLPDFRAHPDELYHRLVHMHGASFELLATAVSSKESGGTGLPEPMITVSTYGRGRVFHTPLGHVWRGDEKSRDSFEDPQFQTLIVRGTEWAASGRVTGDPAPLNQLTSKERAQGFELLFDGRTTKGWRGFKSPTFPRRGWEIDDQALHVLARGGGGDVLTVRRYENFELKFDFRVSKGANSGVIYRVSEDESTTWRTGPEYQVLEDGDHPADSNTSAGSLYALYSPVGKQLKPTGEYNQGRIVIQGDRVEHWLNGVEVVRARFGSDDWNERVKASKFADMPLFGTVENGHLALQDHGNDVWYRNLKIRQLDD